jgi:hypothetical protein
MTDIVERIEDAFRHDTFWDTDAPPLLNDAVAEIKRLRTLAEHTTRDECSVLGDGTQTVGERLVERVLITQAMLDDNEMLRAEISRLCLTESEREAVEDAVAELTPGPIAATLRNLLERLS